MDIMNPEEDRWAEEAFRLWRVRRTLMQVGPPRNRPPSVVLRSSQAQCGVGQCNSPWAARGCVRGQAEMRVWLAHGSRYTVVMEQCHGILSGTPRCEPPT